MHIHICLVSAQLLANDIPILMDKPHKVILLSSAAMHDQAQRFMLLLQQQQIAFELCEAMPDTDLTQIEQFARDLLNRLRTTYRRAQLTVNITGGTKLMSLALWRVFGRSKRHQIIYTDTAKNRLESLQDHGVTPLQAVLTINDYLLAYGAIILRSQSADTQWDKAAWSRRNATRLLAKLSEKPHLQPLITQLNSLCLKALSSNSQQLLHPCQQFVSALWGERLAAVQVLAQMQLLQLADDQQTVEFLDAARTRFLCGHWLEEYAYWAARWLNLNDVACGVDIQWQGSQTHNELDVLVVHNNRLLSIECKTAHLQTLGSKAQDVLYKIDSIGQDLKGLFGTTVLLSALEVPAFMRERAKTQHVIILRPWELSNYLRSWANLPISL
jgi:hypothetical protein